MKFRVWIKSVLAAALAVHCFASLGQAQSPAERTTLARAIELVDAHLDKAQRETNADLKRRLQVEAYLALLSLPSTHRQYEAADRLRAIDEALAEKSASVDREVIEVGLGAARTLAEARDDLQRIFLLDRQYSGLSSGEGVNKQYFLQLMRANDAEAMSWFFQSMQPGVGEVAGIVNRSVGIDWLCQHGHRDLARRVATRLTASELDAAMGLRLADLGAAAEAEQRAVRRSWRAWPSWQAGAAKAPRSSVSCTRSSRPSSRGSFHLSAACRSTMATATGLWIAASRGAGRRAASTGSRPSS
jgi:hypothetical protein